MQHFSDQAWSDYVRGTADAQTRQQIEQHLSQACAECKQHQSTWTALAEVGRREPLYSAPEDLVRLVKQEFTLEQAKPAPMIASLLFDTFAQPLAAGVRSAGLTARQVLYEAGGIAVDLRLESHPGSDQVHAIGQVQDRSSRAFLRPHLPVGLQDQAGATLKQVFTNEFGEFQFEFARDQVARLAIEIDALRTIQIPLADLQGYLQSSS